MAATVISVKKFATITASRKLCWPEFRATHTRETVPPGWFSRTARRERTGLAGNAGGFQVLSHGHVLAVAQNEAEPSRLLGCNLCVALHVGEVHLPISPERLACQVRVALVSDGRARATSQPVIALEPAATVTRASEAPCARFRNDTVAVQLAAPGAAVGDVVGDVLGDVVGSALGDVVGSMLGDALADVLGEAVDDADAGGVVAEMDGVAEELGTGWPGVTGVPPALKAFRTEV